MQSFKALRANTVEEVYPEIIERVHEGEKLYYVGVKNTHVIPANYLKKLEDHGFYIHTRDVMAEGGRAIDFNHLNPITGRYMTGSSSGTAINVFTGINDIGIGTDGGGSVLAPACALNLYGFISPLICHDELKQYQKKSTDGITFEPSIGFMSKDIEGLFDIIEASIELKSQLTHEILLTRPQQVNQTQAYEFIKEIFSDAQSFELDYDSLSREKMMKELSGVDFERHILISFEGPTDLESYGDSVMGHYSQSTQLSQARAHKYYLKVINMLGLSALIVPTFDLSVGVLLISESTVEGISSLLEVARKIPFTRSQLESSYFQGGHS